MCYDISKHKYITIIIPVYNSERTLPLVLDSILRLEYPHKYVRVVIVDDCSTDASPQIAMDFKQKYEERFHSIEVIRLSQRLTTSKVRNEGIKRALPGSYLMFLDSDVILNPTTLTKMIELPESDRKIGALGGLCLTSNSSLFEKLMWYKYLGRVSEGPAGTGALLVKCKVFEKVGFFNEKLGYPKTIYEDLEYVMRIRRHGYKVLIDGREPLLHLKFTTGEIGSSKSSKLKLIKQVLEHFASYLSLRKAYALYKVLSIAPKRYKLEYIVYIFAPFALMLIGLHSIAIALLSLLMSMLLSSLYSLIVYPRNMSLVLRILAGPAILLSRVLRALALIPYIVVKPSYDRKMG
jgi:glycosyltransferase involved in cell wall biosynthesis